MRPVVNEPVEQGEAEVLDGEDLHLTSGADGVSGKEGSAHDCPVAAAGVDRVRDTGRCSDQRAYPRDLVRYSQAKPTKGSTSGTKP